jgi:8-oxo-dGTP pyrophosphatase MutT (NUDIX family)
MSSSLVNFLAQRLQQPLPYQDIFQEDISDELKEFIIKSQKNPPRPPRICAVLVTLIKEDNRFKIPFIQRPKSSRVHPGQIAFPGGGREEQDIDLNETALRETWEEIGITVPKTNIIGTLSDIYVVPSNSMITPVVAHLKEVSTYGHDPKEVDRVLEFYLDDFQNKDYHTLKTIKTPVGTVEMPAFQIGEHLIWGATARILRELVAVID